MRPNVVDPSDKDVAEFFSLAMLFGVSDQSEIIAWAVSLIARDAEPEDWAIEPAMAGDRKTHDMIEILNSAPGQGSVSLSAAMLLSRLWRRWRQNAMTGREIAQKLWGFRDYLPKAIEEEIFVVDDRYDLVDQAIWTESQADEELNGFLSKYEKYESLIPRPALPARTKRP